ncbi:hypothetical protein FQN54_005816 [Arachnomyces sp. PD_36]|nr:hypothetical protein FQN54_005816 [Arachnomyces sp. PD_36]
MEVLQDLQASLAQSLGREFNQAEEKLKTLLAQREARNDEIHSIRLEERDRAYSKLSHDFELRGARIKELEGQLQSLDEWHERALEAETLREDNVELQRELRSLKSGGKETGKSAGAEDLLHALQEYRPESVITQESPPEHVAPDTIPYASYTELADRYRDLFRKIENVVKAFCALRAQNRSNKNMVKDWYSLFDKKTFTIPINGKPTTFRRVDGHSARASRRSPPDQTASAIDKEAASTVEVGSGKHDAPNTLPEERSEEESADGNSSNNHQQPHPASNTAITSSPPIKVEQEANDEEVSELPSSTPASTLATENDNTNREEIYGSLPIAYGTSTSGPLKRKQHQGEQDETTAANSSGYFPSGSSKKPVPIKSEQTSSSPLQNLLQQPQVNNLDDTQDLDDVDKSIQTPRKKSIYSAANVTAPPFLILQDPDCFESAHSARRGHQFDKQWGEGGLNHDSALQPKDRNRNIIRRSDAEDIGHDAKRRRGDRRGAEAIPIITEDGEDHSYKGSRKARGGPKKTRESARLNDLLEAPSSPKRTLTPRTASKSSSTTDSASSAPPEREPRGYAQLSLATPSKRGHGQPVSSAQQTLSAGPFRSGSKRPGHRRVLDENLASKPHTDNTTARDRPYRSHALDNLSLDNFRVNPDRNEGIDYAFDDVVRGRNQRQCLPGCTRPDCCGSRFRAMAKVGGLTALPGREAADEEQELLESYLGDQKHRLETMGENERREILIDAKAEALAARYGRHRYTYERHHSPPGFWRADMPSTQELERDREEARQMEKEKVASRYREAMRPGGMWKFADE